MNFYLLKKDQILDKPKFIGCTNTHHVLSSLSSYAVFEVTLNFQAFDFLR